VHVNRLKPFVSADIRPETDLDEPDLQENPDSEPFDNVSERDPAELAVKSIIDKKVVKNQSGCRQTYYLVEWEDADIEPSWEPLSHLHCSELLKVFSAFKKISLARTLVTETTLVRIEGDSF